MEGKKERFLMLLFSKHITNRLRYIAGFIGEELFDKAIELTDNVEEFQQYTGNRINYSNERIEGAFNLAPHNLLFEKDIKPQQIVCFELNNHKAFFRAGNSDLGFDVFAATFYLLSRYEEYLPHKKDEYERYAHVESLAYREGFLHLPLVNYWLEDLKTALKQVFPAIGFHRHTFKFLPTYDIDMAWSYRNK
ncbi:MAG TPA: hypothetical protein VEB42_04255, partial [Chitinophagaceae bacterium]|nr:hypothetical protein [Chitinophagaceae bacterium]